MLASATFWETMQFGDFTVIVALITAISAIIAPIVTTKINNKHQLKEKRIEATYTMKLNIYNDFFSSYGIYHAGGGTPDRCKFLADANKVLLVCDKESSTHIKEFIKLPSNTLNTVTLEHFLKCSEFLVKDLEESRKSAYSG